MSGVSHLTVKAVMSSRARDGERGVSFPDSIASGRLFHLDSCGIVSWGWGSFGFEDNLEFNVFDNDWFVI